MRACVWSQGARIAKTGHTSYKSCFAPCYLSIGIALQLEHPLGIYGHFCRRVVYGGGE
jgi:hypothetical protein